MTRLLLLCLLIVVCSCTQIFSEAEPIADAQPGDNSVDGAVDIDGGENLVPDANTSGRVTLTLVVESTVGSRQVSISNGEHDGKFCNVANSPCLFSIENPSSVQLFGSVDNFAGWLIAPCNFTENQYTANLTMTLDCTATAYFGELPL